MRILYINHEKNLGGAAKSLLGLIDQLDLKKSNIFVLTPYKNGTFIQECKERNINILSYRFFNPISRKKKQNIIIYLLAYIYNDILSIYLSYLCKKNKITIIHTNSSIINIGNLISKRTHIKQIVHFREFVEEDFGWYFIPNKETVIRQFIKYSFAQIFISKSLENKYKGSFRNTRIQIYNGISFYKEIKYQKKKNSFCIVGRIIEGKCQIQIIEAFNILVNKYKIKNLYLEIIGNGDEKYIGFLKRKIIDYELENNVKLVGYKKNIMMYRSKFEYEVSCSQSEAFGRNIIEAMLVKNIVIASNVGAYPELINDKIDGFLYNSLDINSLVLIILDCVNKVYNLDTIKQNAYIKAINSFSQEKNAKEIYSLYRKVINKNEN